MPVDHIVVPRKPARNSGVYAVIEPNISAVSYLLERSTEPGGLSPDMLGSYYVGYYLAEAMNGGTSQFIFDCNDSHQVLDHITYALSLPGATGHARLFSEVRTRWDVMDAEKKQVFFDGGLFDSLDLFEGISGRVYELNGSEDLIELNFAFIGNHPSLKMIRLKRLGTHLAGTIRTIPDPATRLAERERLAEENKPRYARIIDVIYEEYGMELARIIAGDPDFIYEGEERVAQRFLAGHGYYSMVDMRGRTVVFDDDDDEIAVVNIARVPTG